MNDPIAVSTDQGSAPGPGDPKPVVSTRRQAVAALARALQNAGPGTLAALRRAKPSTPPAAFYHVTVTALDEHLPEAGRRRDQLERRWAVVVSAMASAQGLLKPVPLGEAMAKAGVAEMRVVRLLEGHGEQMPELVRNVVHQLVQKAQPFDPNDLADLVLTDTHGHGRDARRRIARSFYRHEGT